ncbi:TonB-dependent receptor [Spirosoma montaniterrae]|uniref:TonB-dependent receptor plug domain-containing protein n=1 Tax=Spirosoma montaniterrae TaxID=1178516 RepID=A0A1P9WTF6_9BACT|nr:carboxypeptidase-like regulatory domain-containing protein [Spirosoma montaniterrae]AQG78665.1 hypothetical protein AWR27_04535 [Spirosoma montaniterrae]
MNRFVVLLLISLLPRLLSAQTTRVSGVVTYNNVNPIANVSLTLDGTYDGTTTNDKGEFSFETSEVGTFTLTAKATGFVDVSQRVELNGKPTLKLNVVLTTKSFTLANVTVRPRLFDLTDKNKYTVLSPLEVLTTATDGNITSALRTMPGAQAVGESGDLFVRGGTGTETNVFIDGLLVSNFTYSGPANLAARSRFQPGLFKGTFFSTGGYSAQYGQALSSALVLETEDIPLKSSAELSISPILGSAGLTQVSRDRKTSYGGTLSHTNLGLYNALNPGRFNFPQAPRFWDGNGLFRHQFKNGGLLKLMVNGGISNMTIDRANLDFEGVTNRINLQNQNLYSNLTYKQLLPKGWTWKAGLAYGRNLDNTRVVAFTGSDARPDSTVNLADRSSVWQVRNVFSKLVLNRTRLHIGQEMLYTSEQRNDLRYTDALSAVFAETESYVTDRLSARVGVRAEYSSLLDRANVTPRLALGYSAGNNGLLSVSFGQFYQKPERPFLLQSNALNFSRADHYQVSYQQTANDRTFRAEAYYKKYSDLITTTPTLANNGRGYAQGFELFFRDKKTVKGVDYWVSYSFLDTKRQFLNYPALVQPSFAARHTASLVVKRFFSDIKTNVGLAYTVASGRPYANPNRPDQAFMTDRTPAFHNLGLNVAHLMSIRKTQSVLVLTVSNVLGNQQIFGYTYSTTNPARREAIMPNHNPFVFVGLFVNIGVDRRQEIINSQL